MTTTATTPALREPPPRPALPEKIERALVDGDLSSLTVEERVNFYRAVCDSLGINPLTKPFGYLVLNGKLVLYALKNAADQLRRKHHVAIGELRHEERDGLYTVFAPAMDASGRRDEDMGAVPIANLKGEALANARMKAVTKAKRRVTLSMCGLGMLDETEVESIPGARPVDERYSPSGLRRPRAIEAQQPVDPQRIVNGVATEQRKDNEAKLQRAIRDRLPESHDPGAEETDEINRQLALTAEINAAADRATEKAGGPHLSATQRGALFAALRRAFKVAEGDKSHWLRVEADLRDFLGREYGVESLSAIPVAAFNAVSEWAQSRAPKARVVRR